MYDQDAMYLRQLLSLSLDEAFTVEVLEEQDIDDRAFRL